MKGTRFGDPLVLATIAILFFIGVFVLYTTSPIGFASDDWLDSLVFRQLLFGIIAFIIIFVISFIDLQISKTFLIQIFFIGIILLLLAGLFFLGPLVNSTHRWYKIGQFLFQPSEFAKIALALWTAYWITSEHIKARAKMFLGGGGIVATLSLILLQPDFGATIISLVIVCTILFLWAIKFQLGRMLIIWFVTTAVIVLFAALSTWWLLVFSLVPLYFLLRENWKVGLIAATLGGVLVFGTIAVTATWNTPIIPSYVKNRIESFLGTQEETFQIRQSKIAIGSGGLWGKGISQGTQSRLRFLPEYTTDFIFSAFVEERGFAGMMLLLTLYLVLFGRLIFLAMQVKDEYARLIIIGLTVKIWFETFVNLGMNMGVLPTKGVALPFVSYGGSSLVANAIIIGIILSFYRYEAKRDTISPSITLA